MAMEGTASTPVQKIKVKKSKVSQPGTEPKKKSKRKSVELAEAPNTAPEARKKKKVRPENEATPAVAKEGKKKKRRVTDALEAPVSTPEQSGGAKPEATGREPVSGAEGTENEETSTAKKPKKQHTGDDAEAAQGKQGKKRRRRGKKVTNEDELPQEERERRQRQRDLRRLALQMREEGKPYKRPPQKKPKVETQKTAGLYSASQLQSAAQQADEEGSRPDHPVQVIVVPIFWNRKPEEKAQVIQAAEAAVKLLESSLSLSIGIDTTNAMSPGQKFAYWEGQGVMVRIECGPRDAMRRECVLAVSKKAGEVAERQTLLVGPKLARVVGAALGISINASPAAGEPEATQGSALAAAVGAKRVLASGDDLGGDFEGLNVDDDGGGKKKKRKKPKS